MDLMKYIRHPSKFYLALATRGFFNWMPDELYLKLRYKMQVGNKLDLDNPQTYNEKIQWLKLYDRKPEYTAMVDKYLVKHYVADVIGEEYMIPNLGVWERFDDIDFNQLPNQFVLKCTHDSGGLVICKDKAKLDKEKAKKKIERSLRRNYYYSGREWPYKDVKPRIIAEKFMQEDGGDLKDYKFMCFNGEPRCILVCAERASEDGVKMTFFDPEWKVMPFKRKCPRIETDVPKPNKLEKMMELAGVLSKGIPFSRIDFYEISGKIYFGEITFYPTSGFGRFEPDEWDGILGSWIDLPMNHG